MGLFTQIAKELFIDYATEKGLSGMAQDASKVKNFFFGESEEDNNDGIDYQEIWSSFINEIDAMLDAGNYPQAKIHLNDFYKEYGEEEDYYYYQILYNIHLRWLNSIDDSAPMWNKLYSEANNAVEKMAYMATTADQEKEAHEYSKKLKDTIELHEYFLEWDYLEKLCAKEVDNGNYSKAINHIENFYKKHNEEYDFLYYDKKIRVYLRSCEDTGDINTLPGCLVELELMLDSMKSEIGNADNREDYEQYLNRYNAIKKNASSTCSSVPKNSDAENEYLEEYKACLVDGTISEKERRLLSRLAKSLGISDARVQELEALASTSGITEEEREYLNEYRTCLADNGNISEKEQRLLSRLAKSLGISDERVKELQKM